MLTGAATYAEPSNTSADQRSFVSSHTNLALPDVPLSTSIPPSCDGAPVSSEFRTMILSPMLTSFELTDVVVPLTVKSPSIVTSPSKVASLNVTFAVVATS